MTTNLTATMLYLGNFADMDTDESDWDNEDPDQVIGNHETVSLIDVDLADENDDGLMMDNDAGYGSTDNLSYDTGAGTTTSQLDSTSLYEATILLGDGSTYDVQVIVVQSDNGDVFIVEHPSFPLDNLKIQSIELTEMLGSNYSGYTTNPSIDNSEVVCFAAGTMIATPSGDVPVEQIKVGMQVCTLDHGPQTVRWTNASFCLQAGKNAPVGFVKDSLGDGVPHRVLHLSPQHRVLLRSRIVERMFDSGEVLAHAKHLLGLPGVLRGSSLLPVFYHHIACDHHEVIFAEGAPVESFYAGPQARAALSPAAKLRLTKNIPSLRSTVPPPPARPFAQRGKVRALISRHLKHQRALVSQ